MERFGPWNLQRRLGAGGMAEAFLARRADGTGGPVCVKRILPGLKGTPGFAAMFRDEIALTQALRHEHIVAVHDSGDEDGVLWLAMEYVDGPSLAAVLARNVRDGVKPTIGQALEITRQLALGLDAAHTAKGRDGQPLGIVHRDVSPQNILFSRFGTLKLSDFGIARAEERLARTATGVMKGKLGYLAPEQITGDVVDHRADQFAAGIVLWEVLCTRRLFRGPELEVLEAVVGSDVAAPSRFRDDIPPVIDALVARMLKRDPAQRFPTMASVVAALDGLLAQETSSTRALAPLVMIDDESSTMRIPRTRFAVEEGARSATLPSQDTGVWSPPATNGFDEATIEGDGVEDSDESAHAPRVEHPEEVLPASPFEEGSGIGARPWPVARPAGAPPSLPRVPMVRPAPPSGGRPPRAPPSAGAPRPTASAASVAAPSWSRPAAIGIVIAVACLTGAAGIGVGLRLGRQEALPSLPPPLSARPAPTASPTEPVAVAVTDVPPPSPSPPTSPSADEGAVAATGEAWDALLARGRGTACVGHLAALGRDMPRDVFLERAATLIEVCDRQVAEAPSSSPLPPPSSGLAEAAKLQMVRGEYAAAVVTLQQILKRSPNDPRAHLQLGICYAQLRQNSRAREHYGRFLELNPKGPDADRVRKSLDSL